MRKKLILGLLLSSFFAITSGQSPSEWESLSEDASISILTCSPGSELYSIFGHSAIRVSDPQAEIDLVFNYGTFDFNTPFFYLKFGHGSLDYLLSVSSFKRFMREYFIEGRSVWAQELNLSQFNKNRLFMALMINAQSENRAYQYDFFYDNCASRVGDIILDELDSRVMFSNAHDTLALSFREALHPYLERTPWTSLGIDLVLGSPADTKTDSLSIMFLPDYLMAQFEGIQYLVAGEGKNLVASNNLLLDFMDMASVHKDGVSPQILLWLIATVIALLTLSELYGALRIQIVDRILFLAVGLCGVIVAYLWFVSNHVVTSPNWNLIWANPLWILFATNVNTWWLKMCRVLQLFCLFFLVLFSSFLPQYFPAEFFPVWIILALRLGTQLYLVEKK